KETIDEKTSDGQRPEKQESVEPEAAALEAALADARRALELAPDDEAVIVFGVRCLLANDKQEEAGALARRGLTLHAKNASMYVSLADVELKAGHRDGAIALLQRGLEADPGAKDLMWNLANLLIDESLVSQAENTLEMLRKTDYPKPPLAYLDAR